jgi:hypothetical protein
MSIKYNMRVAGYAACKAEYDRIIWKHFYSFIMHTSDQPTPDARKCKSTTQSSGMRKCLILLKDTNVQEEPAASVSKIGQ